MYYIPQVYCYYLSTLHYLAVNFYLECLRFLLKLMRSAGATGPVDLVLPDHFYDKAEVIRFDPVRSDCCLFLYNTIDHSQLKEVYNL